MNEYSVTNYISYKRPIKATKLIAYILNLNIDLKNINTKLDKFAIAYEPKKSEHLLLLHFMTTSKYRIIIRTSECLKQDIIRLTQLSFEKSTYTLNNRYNINFTIDIDFSKGSNYIIERPSKEFIEYFLAYRIGN